MFFSSVKEKYRLINNKTFSKLRFSKFKKFVSRLVLEGSNSRRYHWIRSSRPEVCCKKGALKNFAKFTGKHLCRISFLKKRLWHSCFPVNFAKFLWTPFFKEHLWWLLLPLMSGSHTLFTGKSNIMKLFYIKRNIWHSVKY